MIRFSSFQLRCPFSATSRYDLASVRREKQEPVASVVGWQIRSSTVQLIDDDADVLMAEMSLFLDEVSDGSVSRFPGDNPVESGQGLPW